MRFGGVQKGGRWKLQGDGSRRAGGGGGSAKRGG